MIFVDTNYFLRFLLKDIENQYLEVKKLMVNAAQGEKELFTSTIVFFELYWVLSSYYGKNRPELSSTLRDFLGLEFIRLEERSILREAISIFERSPLSLEDAYNIVFAKKREAKEFKTFDKKLAKFFLEN
jgi:predicted nucleic acid-binding protein